MAQLIKLKNYISRYEWNTYRYPSQYIRLKQENWQKINVLWKSEYEKIDQPEEEKEEQSRFMKWFHKKKSSNEVKSETLYEIETKEILPETEQGLKQYFLNKLFPIQLKWATSTVTDVSFMDKKYVNDDTLKYFLQRFPDTYLLMYYPIFTIKNAPIESEIILISPIGIEIIYLLDAKESSSFIIASDERTWTVEDKGHSFKFLSPLISLKRTEQIINSILKQNNIDFTVVKTVISKYNPIVVSSQPYRTNIVGKHEYNKWFSEKRSLVSPLKNRQLKATEKILQHCESTSVKRPEWEEETDFFSEEVK